LFQDPIFFLEPLEGEVWPHSEIPITVFFRPLNAGAHQRLVYCEISGREERLPLKILGEALGPQAQFSFDKLNIGEVYLNITHKYEVTVQNTGDIDVNFDLIPLSTPFSNKFEFIPRSGTLSVGEHQNIVIEFNSDIIGVFSEEFLFELDVNIILMEGLSDTNLSWNQRKSNLPQSFV
jgi:hydrocephalus-inducing protein